VLIALAALIIVVRNALQQALTIADQVQSGAIPLDAEAISRSIESASANANSLPANMAWLVTIACWLIGIIDAFRIGRIQEGGK